MLDTTWIESNGGPLLLVPEALLTAWSGTDVPEGRHADATFRWQGSGDATDYDRACDIRDYVGVVSVGAGSGLVLSDEPLPTRWIPSPNGGVFARWSFAENEATAQQALGQIPDDLQWTPAGVFTVQSSPLRLIDSADIGKDVCLPNAQIALRPGSYQVAWSKFTPDVATAFVLVRLLLVPATGPSA